MLLIAVLLSTHMHSTFAIVLPEVCAILSVIFTLSYSLTTDEPTVYFSGHIHHFAEAEVSKTQAQLMKSTWKVHNPRAA